MPRVAKPLTAAFVKTAPPGRYADGANLYLLVRSPERKYWCFRYRINGRAREIGLGAAAGSTAIPLASPKTDKPDKNAPIPKPDDDNAPKPIRGARERARELYDQLRDGHDPLELRRAKATAKRLKDAKTVTFKQEAEAYIEAHSVSWSNKKHRAQWASTLEEHVYPKLAQVPVSAINADLVLSVLKPIWSTIPATAGRVRGRIEAILDFAKAAGHREGENPARWKGGLKHSLPAVAKVKRVEHHAALKIDDIGRFMADLRSLKGVSARALEFCVLTCARSNEVRGGTWAEVNLRDKVWTIPANRIKGGREHRVPLTDRALKILGKPGAGALFPGLSHSSMSRVLSRLGYDATVHGTARSTFRDWAAERTNFPTEVCELALAHSVGSKVEQAYRRGDQFQKRRALAEAWAAFCATTEPATGGNVVAIRS
jgi:integrase